MRSLIGTQPVDLVEECGGFVERRFVRMLPARRLRFGVDQSGVHGLEVLELVEGGAVEP